MAVYTGLSWISLFHTVQIADLRFFDTEFILIGLVSYIGGG